MVAVPPNSGGQQPRVTGAPGPGTEGEHPRLNLLLSYAGWQPDPVINCLPPLLEPMGIRSLRAATGREASSVMQSTRVHIAVVDLGLPLDTPRAQAAPELEEGGPRLLELLSRLSKPPPVVAVKRSRSMRDDSRDIAAALRLGAFAIVDRPRDPHDLNVMLDVLRRILARFHRGCWPGVV